METATRVRIRQVFPYGGHLDLAPVPGEPAPAPTGDQRTDARLALALLIARHGQPEPGSKYAYWYEAAGEDGGKLASGRDREVAVMASVLRRSGTGEEGQHAALAALAGIV